MLMRLLTFRRVLRRRRIMPLKGLCKPPAQPVVMISQEADNSPVGAEKSVKEIFIAKRTYVLDFAVLSCIMNLGNTIVEGK